MTPTLTALMKRLAQSKKKGANLSRCSQGFDLYCYRTQQKWSPTWKSNCVSFNFTNTHTATYACECTHARTRARRATSQAPAYWILNGEENPETEQTGGVSLWESHQHFRYITINGIRIKSRDCRRAATAASGGLVWCWCAVCVWVCACVRVWVGRRGYLKGKFLKLRRGQVERASWWPLMHIDTPPD